MIFNVGLVSSTAIVTPSITTFGITKVTIKNNDSYFDKIRLLDTALTDIEIGALLLTDEYEWTDDTRLLMEFDQNLLGGNIGIDTDDIERAILYRAEADTPDVLTTIDDNIDADATSYTDYTAVVGTEYIYYLTLVDSNGATSELFSSNNVTSSYDSFFLIDPTEGVSFRFNLNSSSTPVSKNDNFTVIASNYSQYPITSDGLTFYDTMTINCVLGYTDSSCGYIDTVEYLESLETIIKNTNNKYIKNRAGNIWEVQTSGLRYLADTKTYEHQRTITFNCVEVATVNGG